MLYELFNPEIALNLDSLILVLVSILLFFGLLLFMLGFRRFLRRKLLTASIQSLSGLSFFLAGLLSLSIAINFYSYDRLTYEQPIAELKFNQLGPQQFEVEVAYQNENKVDVFLINGDEWQMDARIIKWHGWAQLMGLNSQYRLERIAGRYSDIEEEQKRERTVYALAAKDEVDFWKLINKHKKWLPWIDAYYGSATYLPMADNSSYSVSLTQSGLIARPLNHETEEKTQLW
jgi:hypothetical protein